MRQLPLATAVVISLVMSACSFFAGQEDDTLAPIVQPAAPPTFSSPIVPARPKTWVAALIQPTNPDERLRTMKSSRADPFAALVPPGSGGQTAAGGSDGAGSAANSGRTKAATAANPTTANTMTTKTGSSGRPAGSSASSSSSVARPRSTSASQSSRSGFPGPSPSSQENGSPQSVPSLPPLPQPELAQGVQVSGIALVNGEPRAIVKAPDETVSRSVSAGDRLSNGQILVKRIEISSAEPVVILEQYGTEVAVGVGTGV